MKIFNAVFALSLLIIAPLNIFAQEESFPCKEANPLLKELFNGQGLENLYIHDCYGPGLQALSSSYLKASGVAPKIIEDPDGGIPEDTDYVNWTCKYSMGNISDNNPSTAWVEGVKGYGIREVLIVPCLDLTKPVEIWGGYGKSTASFSTNSRPKTVRLIIIQAQMEGATQYGSIYKNLHMVSQSIAELEDINDYQSLKIPYYKPASYLKIGDQQRYNYFLGIEIMDVYKGSKWDDTCISEIRNKR